MKKIYCVTELITEYCDQDIPEIPYFTTLEMAKDYSDKMGTNYEVQEINLDKPYSFDKDLKFGVKLDLDNNGELVACYHQNFTTEYISYGEDSDGQRSHMGRIYFYLYAKDAIEAENKAKSMFHEVKNNLETKYKHLKKPCVRYNQHYFSFPRYEYGTGLILLKRGEELDKVEAETKMM